VDEVDALIAEIESGRPGDPAVEPTLRHARYSLVQALDALASEQVRRQDYVAAKATLERALQLEPKNGDLLRNFSTVLLGLAGERGSRGDAAGAIAGLDEAIRFNPANAAALNNLALVHADRLDLDEAERVLRRAIAIDPDYAEAHFNLSRMLLMQRKYAEGWRENEWRWDCPAFPSTWRDFPYSPWTGTSLAGQTVLVWSEQGIGDEIMFANPVADAIAEAKHVVLECNARLVPIFRRSFAAAAVVARSDPPDPAIARANIDVQLPLASLCLRYRASPEAFANNPGRYLFADPERTRALRSRYAALGKGLLIGICWRSGNPKVGHERSAPLPLWDGVLAQSGCRFVSLQYGGVADEIAAVRERLGVVIHNDKDVDPLASAEDWFAQVAAMDHVISIDNSTIQVSGAQGIPTWTLLSHAPEWRFGAAGSGHDWHPSIRVFSQPAPGDWGPVFAAVEQALAERLAAPGV